MKKILIMFMVISSMAALLMIGAVYLTKQAGENEGEKPGHLMTGEPTKTTYLTPGVIWPEQMQKKVMKSLGLKTVKTVYNQKYQDKAEQHVKKLKKKAAYPIEEPLLILNPFGTNQTGLYIYFEYDKRVNVTYTVSVNDKTISDFTAELFTNETGMPLANQEGQIIGLMQGMTNYIELCLYDEEEVLVDRVFYKIAVPDYGTISETKLKYDQTRTANQLTDGLFCLFGYDRANDEEPRHLLFYDNEGNIRAEIPVDGAIQDVRIEYINGNIFYACGRSKFALVNRLGKADQILSLQSGYTSHHDFCYVPEMGLVMVLVNSDKYGIRADGVMSLDIYTGKSKLVIDLGDFMPDIKAGALTVDGQKDWAHFNSLSMTGDGRLLISARESSTILQFKNVPKKPVLDYMIADSTIWKGTKYQNYLLKKKGTFASQGGQHTAFYEMDSSLPKGQYYVCLFNNNYGLRSTYPSFDWSVIPGIGLPGRNAEYSYYYKYLVNEKKKTYELVQSIELPYSATISSVQNYKNNIVTCSGWASVFEEYNGDGKQIARYYMDVPRNYRVFKYDMKGYWFAQD